MEVEAGAGAGDAQIQQKGRAEEQEEKHFHVLAVDDSLIDRKLLERLLRVSSYQVTCVDSGDKALEYLGLLDNLDTDSSSSSSCSSPSPQQEDIKVNLIMTDYCMPGISGYDLLKRVKESPWKDVPVVIMSSENIPSRISMCLEGGAEEFLLKPLQLSDVEKLQSHLLKTQNYYCKRIDDNLSDGNSNGTKNDNNIIKRKAILTEPSEKRLKLEGLAVI